MWAQVNMYTYFDQEIDFTVYIETQINTIEMTYVVIKQKSSFRYYSDYKTIILIHIKNHGPLKFDFLIIRHCIFEHWINIVYNHKYLQCSFYNAMTSHQHMNVMCNVTITLYIKPQIADIMNYYKDGKFSDIKAYSELHEYLVYGPTDV